MGDKIDSFTESIFIEHLLCARDDSRHSGNVRD